MSSFLLQDIPRHDTRVIEVREAFEHISLLGFHPNISADTAKKKASGGSCGGHSGPLRATRLTSPVAVPLQTPDLY